MKKMEDERGMMNDELIMLQLFFSQKFPVRRKKKLLGKK
jgi:hypothetical protein